jgi:hypothetical protein
LKAVQILINEEGSMRKIIKKSLTKKALPKPAGALGSLALSANQRRFLHVLENGTDLDEPSLLAGRP